eukprot:1195062-Prorocentrum_minimum.AAC.4
MTIFQVLETGTNTVQLIRTRVCLQKTQRLRETQRLRAIEIASLDAFADSRRNQMAFKQRRKCLEFRRSLEQVRCRVCQHPCPFLNSSFKYLADLCIITLLSDLL